MAVRGETGMRYALLMALSLAACGNPQREKLDRGVAFAARHFREATRNPAAAAALGSITETGGTLTTYIYASMPDKADLPRFNEGSPSEPWSIALRAFEGDKVIIEGYGDSLNRPLVAETVSVRFGPRR